MPFNDNAFYAVQKDTRSHFKKCMYSFVKMIKFEWKETHNADLFGSFGS